MYGHTQNAYTVTLSCTCTHIHTHKAHEWTSERTNTLGAFVLCKEEKKRAGRKKLFFFWKHTPKVKAKFWRLYVLIFFSLSGRHVVVVVVGPCYDYNTRPKYFSLYPYIHLYIYIYIYVWMYTTQPDRYRKIRVWCAFFSLSKFFFPIFLAHIH